MKLIRTRVLNVCLAAMTTTLVAHAQVYKLHNADVAVGATGQFTRTITSDSPNVQQTTDSPGFLLSFRDHPVAWAGVELNYGFTRYSQRYSYGAGLSTSNPASVHEATAAYLFHPHFKHLQPFVGVGGGALGFRPGVGSDQWRGAGLVETGLDIPTRNRHLGFRVQGRTLFYRAPNFGNSQISSRSWVASVEPSASVYIRF